MIESSLRDAYEVDGIAASIETLGLEHLAKRDIRLEFADLLAWMADVKASYFCHNDFRRGNILVVQDPPGEETVKLVDFEYCSFGFRGFDLASFLLEWGREKFDKRPVQAPSDEVIKSFVKLYIDACNEVVPGFSQDPDNALEKIVLEAKKCMLFNYFFLMSFILQQKEAFIKGMPFSKETNLVRFCFLNCITLSFLFRNLSKSSAKCTTQSKGSGWNKALLSRSRFNSLLYFSFKYPINRK